MKSIYWKGKVYEGVSEFSTLTPITEHTMRGLYNFLENFPSIPVSGPHNFKDGQLLVEGVDYEKKQDKYRTGIFDNNVHEEIFEEP